MLSVQVIQWDGSKAGLTTPGISISADCVLAGVVKLQYEHWLAYE